MRIPHRWVIHRRGRSEHTVRNIRPGGVVILLNDHHLDDLTGHINSLSLYGRNRDERLWVGVATERVIDSPHPKSENKTKNCARICHLVAHFDPWAAGLIRQEGADPFFLHQYVDHLTFHSRKSFEQKKPRFFWSGKLPRDTQTREYVPRQKLWELIRGHSGLDWREAGKPDMRVERIVEQLDSYQGLINLPSNCPGYTAAFFERLAMGALTLQYRTGTTWPEGLEPGRHFLEYDPNRPEELLEMMNEVLLDPRKFSEMARDGKRACLKSHTLTHRIRALFGRLQEFGLPDWLESALRNIKE